MHAYSNTEFQDPIPVYKLQVHSSNVSSNRIKIQEILLILQLETDYFSKLFISEMHSKQWHYSLHRDFQNCYSTRRSPTGFFKLQLQFQLQLQLQFYKGYPYTIHPHTSTRAHPENSPFRNPILHTEDRALRVLLLHYRFQKFYA